MRGLRSWMGVLGAVSLLACGPGTSGEGSVQSGPTGVDAQSPGVGSTSADLTLEEGLDSEERAFLVDINNHRAANGLPPLQVSVALSKAADYHSREMADHDYFSHTLLNNVSWSQNMCNYGYCYSTYKGENIAAGNADAQATFLQWKNSAGHNANMLSANYKVIGIGRAYNASSTYKWYWTTTFGGYVDEVMTAGGAADGGAPAPDAGAPDAGAPDAGTPTPDAGVPDAGSPAPDAGSPDAGSGGTVQNATFTGSLAQGQSQPYGPFAVIPGTSFQAVLSGTGDADLYVRFGAAPTRSSFNCRPYLNTANESCTLTVPTGVTSAYVMVDGYTAASYSLRLTYVAP